MQKKIRNLKAEEIECRVASITQSGIVLLLYKNARVDQMILDETFTIFGWKREHCMIGGSLYCTISIWDEEKCQWISKMDVGKESNTEKEKGAASDAFKRACVNLGIGRELYSAPFIFIPINKVMLEEKNGKQYVKDSFSVSSISISEEKVITALQLINQKSERVYIYHQQPKTITTPNANMVEELKKELARTGVQENALLKRYKINSIQEMDGMLYQRALSGLKKTKDAAA